MSKAKLIVYIFLAVGALASGPAAASAALPFLHPLFTDHMVLQRDAVDPVWGWTTPGGSVTVTILDQNGTTLQTRTATAAADGRWQAGVGPFALVANNAAYRLSVTGPGGQGASVSDVLIGDVWLCSGQSNMEYTLYGNYPPNSGGTYMANSANEINSSAPGGANYAANNFIRHFKASRGTTATTPQVTFIGGVDNGGWTLAASNASAFTAVGYFMARQIYLGQGVPVGLLNITWGGTDITPWVPAFSLRNIADFTAAIDSGTQTQGYYNAMIAPAAGFGLKGFVWYQGESSTGLGGPKYGAELAALRNGVRTAFGQPGLPFIAVQVCTNGPAQTVPVEATNGGSYAEIREAQENVALADANSRAVVTIDCTYIDPSTATSSGSYNANVHPCNKQDMGLRTGQAVLNLAYGQTTQYLSPSFNHATVAGGAIRCYFDNVGNGLMVGLKPQGLTPGAAPAPSPVIEWTGGSLTGFAVAGANKTFYTATATIDPATNTVVVSSASVSSPLYVRYGWGSNPWNKTAVSYPSAPNPNPGVPLCNLYRKVTDANGNVVDGVPMSPFRNDPVAQLSVNSGSGSNTYSPGQAVGITASAAPAGESFAFWSGDTNLLANPSSAATTATLSRTYVSVRANYYLNTAPAGISGTAGSLSAQITWNAVANAATYTVKRSASHGGPYTVIASGLQTTSYTDTNTGFGSPLYYVVTASNAAGESPNSAEAVVTPNGPGAVVGFAGKAGDTVAYLTWNASASVTGYLVARSTVSGGPYTTIAANVPGLSYVDTGLANGTTYYYTVAPLVGGSIGMASSEVSVVPSTAPALLTRNSGGTPTGTTATGDNGTESPTQAFDGSVSTKWYTQASPTAAQPDFLQYQFGNNSAWAVTQYQITSANDVTQRDPAAWQLLASNDGYTWTVLNTQTGQSFASRNLTKTYAVTNPAPYRFYRLSITANSGGSGYGLQLSEFALFSSPSDPGDKTAPVLTVPANITAPATGANGATVNYSVMATDAVSGALTPVCSSASGSVFPVGTSVVQCAATDLAGNVAAQSFVVTVQQTYNSYSQRYFPPADLNNPARTGPTADYDGDGAANLLEYFQGTDPTVADYTTPTARDDGAGKVILTFRMGKYLSGVSYVIQQSTDLAMWTASGINGQVFSDQGSFSVMQATVPKGDAPRLFLRIVVTAL